MVKTAGLAEALRMALAPLAARIRVAFIYGSVAEGVERPGSDVDVMVIGTVGFGEVVSALRPAQDQIGRELNPSVFSPSEWAQRRAAHDHFSTTVLNGGKLFLVGQEDELAGVA
jgi:predicted nucleotidyltransferase